MPILLRAGRSSDGRQLARGDVACTGRERELLAQIEAAPHETGPLLVYADWLETSERHDEAAVVRARLP